MQNLDREQVPFPLAGVDEAGRGCLAGPVVAAAAILPRMLDLPELNDSKKLSPVQRVNLEKAIKTNCLSWSLGLSWPREIEQLNILQATLKAMGKAISGMTMTPQLVLVDGNQVPDLPIPMYSIVHGDNLHPCISAASVLAKTFRDRLMISLDKKYPQYGFAQHKGYFTRLHRERLELYGPCCLHRKTFKPLAVNKKEKHLCLPHI